ncbi:MAG: ribose transport system ATP-binding protein [Tepidanaerobacteraceae bacterium]|nr:ribose transport system ATP-binding protein [Tepidanaerobacteraceae bacterium]MDK2879111.1 ribose transport system ATP-binding protein [Thermoanaerobacteraceae bacterium]
MDEIILQMKNITKKFPGVLALDEAQLEVKKGEVHILVGENGAGKSTLMKILAGAYTKDSGEIYFKGEKIETLSPKHAQELGISIIYQELNLIPYLTVAENIFLGREPVSERIPGQIDWKRLFDSAQEILNNLHVDIDARAIVKSLGIAKQQMVEVAKALSLNSDIIIMDEPTAALTRQEIENLFDIIRRVKQKGVSIIYISHRLEEFSEIGDRVTVMRDGKTIATLDIKDIKMDELIKLMVGRELKEKFPKIHLDIGKDIMRVANLRRGDVLKDISFSVREGEILGIAGLIGAGRTELARAIFGFDRIDRGDIYVDGKKVNIRKPWDAIKCGIGLVPEDRKGHGLVLTLSVRSNITLASLDGISQRQHINLKKEASIVKDYIKKLNIKTPGHEQKVASLSGGNQQKVVLAKWLLSKSRIFIFDEPTRGIDVGAKIEVYHLMNDLVKNGAGIILISSELPEILGMCDRILVMCRGEITAELKREDATQEKILYFATGGGKYVA